MGPLHPSRPTPSSRPDPVNRPPTGRSGVSTPASRSRVVIVAIGVVLVSGALLRTLQFTGGQSLWHDEIRLALNVEERGMVDLVSRPLHHEQVAPVGWLALLEISTSVVGVNDAGLRLVPWLVGLAALFLFWRVSRRFLSTPAVVTGLILFAFGIGWIWYGASPKQYGADVAVTLLLVWLALGWRDDPDDLRSGALAGLGGGLALLLSHPAVVVGFVIGLVLVADWWTTRPRPRPGPLGAMAGGWAAGALAATVASLATLDRGVGGYMQEFHAGGFPPPLSQPIELLLWAPRQIATVLGHALFYQPFGPLWGIVGLALVAAVAGAIHLARRHPRRALLLAAPIVAGVLAAAAHLLPFRHRLAVYAAWPVLVFAMWGIEALWRGLPGWTRHVATALGVLIAAPLVVAVATVARPPLPTQESRGVLAGLSERLEPGDDLYATCGGRFALPFYGKRVGISAWDQGECHDDLRAYLREIDRYRGGPRTWVFHMQSHGEAELIERYLGTIGVVRDSIPGPHGFASARLYDLSDPARLTRASAGTFPIEPAPERRP